MSHVDHLKPAQFHAKECVRSIRKAADAIGIDIDAPLQESGLIPPSPDDDINFPDHIEPTAPLDDELENPQSQHRAALRLSFALLRRIR
jgi:hypothetical protein